MLGEPVKFRLQQPATHYTQTRDGGRAVPLPGFVPAPPLVPVQGAVPPKAAPEKQEKEEK
jgi:hypothetical protein